MDVILLERINRLGGIGDTVRVRDGYARNYLLPTGRGRGAHQAHPPHIEAPNASLIARNEERRTEAQGVAGTLDGKSFVIVRSAGETGQLYGSVSARDIADLLKEQGFAVNRNAVELNLPIKSIGLHSVKIALHPEVEVSVQVNVARSPDEAERQARGEQLNSAEAIYGIDEEELEENEDDADGETEEEAA